MTSNCGKRQSLLFFTHVVARHESNCFILSQFGSQGWQSGLSKSSRRLESPDKKSDSAQNPNSARSC